jgi:hypothetical protein
MKHNAFFIGTMMLVLVGSLPAIADNTLQFDADLAGQETASSMTWPMLPGESVNDVARLFYPKNSVMQQQFVNKTLRLNTDIQLKASQRFESPTLLAIPTLKSLSKNSAKLAKKQNNKSLSMSYALKQAVEILPQKLLQDYQLLLSKNAFLKEQLVKLNEKIVFLETKLGELKLIFDKTLSLPSATLPSGSLPSDNLPTSNLPVANDLPSAQTPAQAIPEVVTPATRAPVTEPAATLPNSNLPATKKVFKNLNKQLPLPAPAQPIENSWLDNLNMDLVKAALVMLATLLLGAFALKKYRERMFAQLSFVATKIQNTVTDFSGFAERPKQEKVEPGPETIQQLQAAREIEDRLSATLEEAKLLMSVNRGTDAIAHLKLTIESQPKASINHWLYLLEVFRKLNLKDEFENYAEQMHETFNVMTPVWYEKEAAINTVMIVPQSLEEFPHIMDQLYGVWPGELASVYLRSLITDNRGGERSGFGKAVVAEILFLIELLDTHKDIPN